MRYYLSIIGAILVAAVGVGLLAVAQQKPDRIIKIGGTAVSGHLDSVDESNVTVDGRGIARSEVKAILFAGSKGLPPSGPSGSGPTDLVVRRLGSSSFGHVSQVTDRFVVQNGK